MTNLTESTTVDLLAADIREVDGNHSLGAGALAEALAAKGWTKPQAVTDAHVDAAVHAINANGAVLYRETVRAALEAAWKV